MPRVLTARFMHETNTFSRVKTDMALIRRRDFHLENEIPQAFRGTRSALGATFEAADKYGWTLVHPVSANPNPSGIVTDDAFEQIAGMILETADTKGPVDGALLYLHGAMVTKAHEDAEGELLALLRQKRHRQLVASGQLNLRQRRWNQSSLQTDTADFGPDLEFLGPGGSVLGGSDMITAKMEQVVDLIVGGEEPLRLAGRFELLHLPLSSARRLVRVFRSVVEPLVLAMLDARHHLSSGRAVAGKLVGDHDAGRSHLLLQQLA